MGGGAIFWSTTYNDDKLTKATYPSSDECWMGRTGWALLLKMSGNNFARLKESHGKDTLLTEQCKDNAWLNKDSDFMLRWEKDQLYSFIYV